MSEYTRGPWKWIKQYPSGGWALVTDDPEQDGVVAESMGNGICFPNDGGEQDANLIAAAPDLLKALEEVRDLDNQIIASGGPSMPKGMLEKVDAALAKARGED